MNEFIQWGGHPVVHRLGWTLVHFLWQGAVIAALFAVAQTGQTRRSSHARYWTGCLALLLMLAAPVITFLALGPERTMPAALSASETRLAANAANRPALAETASPLAPNVQDEQPRSDVPPSLNPDLNRNRNRLHMPGSAPALHLEKSLPAFVFVWLLGVSALTLRLLFSSLRVARLKRRGSEPLDAPWMVRLERLKAALQISRPVRLVKSALVEVPAVVGWLRPVVLLPAASLMGLTPSQLESILAHELAHVRRHDYLVNLLQNALETLLFYHPAVWWVSSCVRAEREICCDEIAVQLCGNRLVYAQALAALEQLRALPPTLALGADGGSLLERIRRLSGAPVGGSFPGRRRAGGVLVTALVAIIFVFLLHHPSGNAKAQATPTVKTNQTHVETSMAPHPPGALNGAVLLPNGQPAAGAELVLQVTNDLLFLDVAKGFLTENGMTNRPEDGARFKSTFAIADAGGHFHLPPMENVAALLAIHPQGFTWMAPDELKADIEVRLEPLGRVEGTFRFGTRPGGSEEILLGADEPRLHLFSDHLQTMTDGAGRFVFTNLPAIRFALTRMFRMDARETNFGKGSHNTVFPGSGNGLFFMSSGGMWISSERTHVLVKGGGTTEVELGGTGRPVVGKLAKAGMAFDWKQAYVKLSQQALPKPDIQWYMAWIAADGTFRVENVGAGDYDLAVYVSPDDGKPNVLYVGGPFSVLTRHVAVPEMAGGRSMEALDLGSLEIQHPQPERRIKVGERAPAITATNSLLGFGGGPLNPADELGQYVLLDLCGNYFDSDLPFLRATHDAFGADSRVVIRTVTLGYMLEEEFHTGLTREREPVPWSHAYTGPIQMADWAEAYGLLDRSGMVRQIVWIGPNGKILAKDLHGKDIKATVAQALAVNPDPKGTSTPPLVPPSGKTNIGEKPPAAPNQVNAASGPVNSTKPAANPSGVALEIRCTTNVFKVGDEIPIEFILSNHGTKDYTTKDSVDGAFVRFNLVVKTNFGENIYRGRRMLMDGFNPVGMLHPGESFSKIVALNHWAVIREPGRYEVAVTYVGNSDTNQTMAPVNANPVTITVSPRTREEMHNYIEALTNQVAARLEKRVSKQGGPADAVMDELVLKLTYTCSPEIVPTLLGLHYDTGPRSGNESAWEGQALQTALLNYVPKTEETWQAILQAVFRHGLDWTLTSLLESYKFHNEELKPIIERALAADNPGQWNCGAMLAGDTYYDDSFTDRLIAIATDTNTLGNTRAAKQSRLAARDALARNRTDAGVKTLKMLLNDPAPENWAPLGANILIGYWETNRMGKRLHPEDFEANELRPLNERLLASTNFLDNDVGLSLALHFGDDALTPKLIALATKPGFKLRERAVWALAYNRTDESVKTLKTLLSDPDPKISKLAEEAIRYAYNSRGDARGRPLRADDFDAKFREPEVTPAK